MFTRNLLLLGVAGSALFLLPGDCADAGCHPVAIQQQAVVAYQPVYTPYLYSVGSNLQTQASEERIANLVIQKLQAAQVSAPGIPDNSPRKYGAPLTKQQCLDLASEYEGTAAAFPDDEPPAVPAPQTLPLTAEVDRWQLVKANCQACHVTNQAAKEHVDMTDLSALSCEQKLACIAAMLDGRMPKGKQIDSQTFANILGEFSGAATAHSP